MLQNNSSDSNNALQQIPRDELPSIISQPSDDLPEDTTHVDIAVRSDDRDPDVSVRVVGTTGPTEVGPQPAIVRGTVIREEGETHTPHPPSAAREGHGSPIPSVVAQVLQVATDKPSSEGDAKQGSGGTILPASGGNHTTEILEAATVELLLESGRYIGEIDRGTRLPQGKGLLYFNEGDTYNGEWRNGMANGYGERSYVNGDVYRGQWVDGRRSGPGEYFHVEGHHFKGNYANDERDGYGILVAINGDRYAGMWSRGRKDGKGEEFLNDGQKFFGQWRNGKKQGRGRLYLPGIAHPICGVWNKDDFFRELTTKEMGDEFEVEFLDNLEGSRMDRGNSLNQHTFSGRDHPQDATHLQVTEPEGSSGLERLSSRVTAGILGGLGFIEDRLEALGRAFETVTVSSPPNIEMSETRLSDHGCFGETAAREGPKLGAFPARRTGNAGTLGAQEDGMAQSLDLLNTTEVVNVENHTHDTDREEELHPTQDVLYAMSLQENEPLDAGMH